MTTLGERLIGGLEAYGVDTVFGIPGVHTVALYRGLAASGLTHVTPRHEQGAGFMADGYARATGRVAAAFVITGPGLTNILTPMAQAYADSIPMLVVSSVNRTGASDIGRGDLHEVRNQGLIAAQAAAFSHTIRTPEELPAVLARAWSVFRGQRPRPVHIQIPVDLLSAPAPVVSPTEVVRGSADQAALAAACEQLRNANAPLVLCGGGGIAARVEVLARKLDAPVISTTNARGVLRPDNPLNVPASPSLSAVRSGIDAADLVVAIGTEIGRTDYDMYEDGGFEIRPPLIRIDIDPMQIASGPPPVHTLVGDAAATVDAMIAQLPDRPTGSGAARAAALRDGAVTEIGARYRAAVHFLETVRDALPGTPVIGDSTQAIYAGNLWYAAPAPRTWFNAATGYGALGYGLPAAIGASIARSGPTVALCGDGGLQFSLAELGTAVEERLPVIVLVWNNHGYGEIKSYMIQNDITPVGVDLHTPDFVALARAYGAEAERVEDLDALPGMLKDAARRSGPTLIEISERAALGQT